jgi:stress response protein YsnF
MSRVVTGAYRDRAEAEEALAALARQVPVTGHAALGRGDDPAALEGIGLGAEARAGLARQIADGSVVLLARVADEATADRAIEVLRALAAARAAAGPENRARSPVTGDDLRIGERRVARGGARVSLRVSGQPAREQASLREEPAAADSGPAGRRLAEEEAAKAGLLRERVFELSETRQMPVVEKQAVVREELVVRKTVGERVEQVEETVRRTEVEIEELPAREPSPPRAAFGFDGSRRTL